MKTIKTENAKIEVEFVSFQEAGDIHIIVRTEGNNPIVLTLPASIIKSKFTDAAFVRCITDFFIKDK